MTDNAIQDRPRESADSIEGDIRRTQDAMGDTVEKLEDKMNPRDITHAAMGEEGTDIAREALDVTRQNPVPVAMIAVGLIWLLATSRSPMITRITDRFGGRQRESRQGSSGLRPRSAEPAPIGPSPARSGSLDRRPALPLGA